jgi:site-specific DNA-methyltransferase (adenine-specific)
VRVLRRDDVPASLELDDDLLVEGDCADVLARLPAGAFDLVYLDPPFNTGRRRERRALRTTADADGDRTGFGGRRYRTELLATQVFADAFED